MKSGKKAGEKRTRKTLNFDAEAMKIIEAYQKGCSPIPSFTKAVNEIVNMSKDLVDVWLEKGEKKEK